MKVLFLGTGPSLGVPVPTCNCPTCSSGDPKDKRLRSSVYISTADVDFLIDCGPDFRQQALKYGIRKIDFILITHKHNDHIAGLDDLRPYNYLQKKVMNIYGSSDSIQDIRKRFYYSFDKEPYPGAPKLELFEIFENNDFSVNGVQFQTIEGMHGEMPVLGYRIDDFCYITDFKTISTSGLEKAKGSRILVINALFPDREYRLHFNLEEALSIANRIDPELVYLTHLSHWFPPYEKSMLLLPNNVHMAWDGLELEI